MKPSETRNTCAEIASLFVFYLCDEVEEHERIAIEQHVAVCESCREQLKTEREFQAAIETLPQAADTLDRSEMLLSQCRSELQEKLDDLATPAVKHEALRFAWFRRWMVIHPAWSGALLVAFGLAIGAQGTQWYASRNADNGLDHAVNVRPGPRLTDDQLSKMAVAGINFTPVAASGKQNVRLQLSAEEPVVLTGSLEDTDVRRVLTYVVKNGERFDAGVRLDCLDALKHAKSRDTELRGALLAAARRDQNPAVRLKALDALQDSINEREVRELLLQALENDSNPGVRVEAVNLLVRSLEQASPDTLIAIEMSGAPEAPEVPAVHALPAGAIAPAAPDESMVRVVRTLEDLQHRDPSRYVRMRSAAALRQISARNEQ